MKKINLFFYEAIYVYDRFVLKLKFSFSFVLEDTKCIYHEISDACSSVYSNITYYGIITLQICALLHFG